MDAPFLFELRNITGTEIVESLAQIPEYHKFSDVGGRVIKFIHGIPENFSDDFGKNTLSNTHLYLGCSTYLNVINRFKSHKNDKKHTYGAILCKSTIENAFSFESLANRLILRLQDNESLCVANISCSKANPNTSEQKACIYVTWKFTNKPKELFIPTPSEVKDISNNVYNDSDKEVTKEQILRVTDIIRRQKTNQLRGTWHPEHL